MFCIYCNINIYDCLSFNSINIKNIITRDTKYVLSSLRNDLSNVLSSVNGIVGYREPHFGEYEPGKLVGSIHIQIDENSNEQQLLSQIHDILRQRFGFKNEKDLTIQIEKQSFLDRCDPIHHSVYSNIIPIRSTLSSTKNNKHKNHKINMEHHHDHTHNEQHNHDHDHDHHHNHNHSHNHNHYEDYQHLSDNSNSSFIKLDWNNPQRT